MEQEKTYRFLINNINMKKFAWWKCREIFLEAIFSHLSKLFSKFQYEIFVTVLLDITGIKNFPLSFSKS